jgi:hypothetical protein
MIAQLNSLAEIRNNDDELYDQWIAMWTRKILAAFHGDWDAYMISILFHPLGGSHQAKLIQMHRAAERLYNRLATRTVRDPRSIHKFFLPMAVFVPDYPVPKSKGKKSTIADVSINDGLHLGGLIIANRMRRITTSLKTHFDDNRRTYRQDGIRSIGIDAITHDVRKVVDYTFKSLERGTSSFDDVRVHSWRDIDLNLLRAVERDVERVERSDARRRIRR